MLKTANVHDAIIAVERYGRRDRLHGTSEQLARQPRDWLPMESQGVWVHATIEMLRPMNGLIRGVGRVDQEPVVGQPERHRPNATAYLEEVDVPLGVLVTPAPPAHRPPCHCRLRARPPLD